ncbi:MAG TPA: hypothetical protein VEM96_08640 [Pyrinomonadaceae bacterium]|nr:hypothetical protein [Pyrinomonadaceae bacterium]
MSAAQRERLERELRESKEIERQALELGIDIPKKEDWWRDDAEDQIAQGASSEDLQYLTSYWLSPQGKAATKRLIREELARIKDRKIRWICQIVAAVTGLGGAIIGILAIILAMLRK